MAMKRASAMVVGILVAALFLMPAAAKDNKTEEQYAAVIMAVGGRASGATPPLDIWIDRFTPDEEVVSLAVLLKEKGMEALRRAMEKKDVGRISVSSRGAVPIALARSLVNGKNRILRLFIARNVMFLEDKHLTRSSDYPFSIIELQVDEKGNGEGTAIAAARIRFDEKNKQFVVESLGQGSEALKLVNVRKY